MERIYPGLCFIERVWLDVSYFSSFIAKLWHNYLEGISKGEEVIMRDTHLLVIIVTGGIINVGEIRINMEKRIYIWK